MKQELQAPGSQAGAWEPAKKVFIMFYCNHPIYYVGLYNNLLGWDYFLNHND